MAREISPYFAELQVSYVAKFGANILGRKISLLYIHLTMSMSMFMCMLLPMSMSMSA